MEARYPRLAAKHGHKDAEHNRGQKPLEKFVQDAVRTAKLAELLLDSGIVSSRGMVPPFRVVASVLRTGRSPVITGKQCSWQPIELDEGDYWSVLRHLEKATPYQLRLRPELHDAKIQLDPRQVPNDDYDLWIESLRMRGLS
jgi:hypothetical protein